MANLKEQLKNLPQKPGVYIMKDASGEIIYVGKAVNLKNRVRQYFQSLKNQSPKVRAMVSRIENFEYIITDSELEALILECNLIKKYRPKYNILLKDDKHYPYIKVTMNEDYPRIIVTRRIEKDGAKYFGPYSGTYYVNDTIETIKKIFPIRTCKKVLPRDIGKGRPCLNYHIKRCLAPCQNEVSKEQYKEMMKEVCLFLGGRQQELIDKLEEQMTKASKDMNFEGAAILRDKINSIRHIGERQKVISSALEDQDVIAFASNESDTVIQVFFVRGGKLIGREKFMLDGAQDSTNAEILHQFIKQFYSSVDSVPREILLQEDIDEANIIESWLSSKRGTKVHIRVPKKGEKHELMEMVYKNAVLALDSISKTNPEAQIIEQLKDLIQLEKAPNRIEAYDISNISGSLSVGSLVTFINGVSKKNQYRRYRIKTIKGANDYGSMQEVLFRRFSKDNNLSELPDLICIDGGKGHVNAALEVLKHVGLDIPVCGLVKDSKHKTRGIIYNNHEYDLKNNRDLFKFVTNIQDEVHRFAIEYHKLLREKSLKKSILDQIEGIGEKRKLNLLNHFKSIDKIKNATIEELSEVEGMNKLAAQKIYYYFHI